MNDVTVREVLAEKAALERDIVPLVREFVARTGVSVRSITIEEQRAIGAGGEIEHRVFSAKADLSID